MTADEMEAQSASFKAMQDQNSGQKGGDSRGVLVAERTTTMS
tara:strand:- start:244 stop:369 length:126 start_codon:yes stop_codon:yes gene_type:complete